MDFVETLKLVGAVLAALIASRTIGSGFRTWYRKGWGSRRVWRRKLNLLANGATAAYMENLLGTPIFINEPPESMWLDEEEEWVDRIFSTPHAWVVTRSIGERVEGWSVTITDPYFWWDIEDMTFKQVRGRLGRSVFSELLDRRSGQYESSGARSFVYAESVRFGNPAGYQTFIFMHNQEGVGTFKHSGRADVRVGDFQRPGDPPEFSVPAAETTRAETVANTVIVTTHKLDFTKKTWQLWPIAASDQTRLLHRFQRKSGWRKKRAVGGSDG
ncbi:ETEC_3214 domain-containing protein [Arthrobacter sp. KNU40]|uniref:ETEC_3214 domain-containing protein n=1 Tax=Arthrobacter sp. KNU40 TaxID=3447965 RepID=UPI003F62F765